MARASFDSSRSKPALRRRRLLAAGIAAPALALTGALRAQARPLRLVVPFAAGGPADTMGRAAAAAYAQHTGAQTIVENRPGAGGNIAAAYVAGSAPDGGTVLLAGQGVLAINKALYGNLSYDPERDFDWIAMLGVAANVLLVNPSVIPGPGMAQFLEQARAKPQGISYGSNGVGSLSHLTTEVLARAAGVSFLHVPYQGAAPQRADLLGGRIGFSFIATSTSVPLVREGRLRALAVSTASRVPALPEVPTLVESGFPMLDVPTWFGVVAPSATPVGVLNELRAGFRAALGSRAYAGEMEKQASVTSSMTLEEARAMLVRERKLWTDAVRASGATAS